MQLFAGRIAGAAPVFKPPYLGRLMQLPRRENPDRHLCAFHTVYPDGLCNVLVPTNNNGGTGFSNHPAYRTVNAMVLARSSRSAFSLFPSRPIRTVYATGFFGSAFTPQGCFQTALSRRSIQHTVG